MKPSCFSNSGFCRDLPLIWVAATADAAGPAAEAPPPPRARGGAQQAQRDAAKAAKADAAITSESDGEISPASPIHLGENEQPEEQGRECRCGSLSRWISERRWTVRRTNSEIQPNAWKLCTSTTDAGGSQKNEAMNKLKELNDQKASEEEIPGARTRFWTRRKHSRSTRQRRFYRKRRAGVVRSTKGETESIYGQHGAKRQASHPEIPQ